MFYIVEFRKLFPECSTGIGVGVNGDTENTYGGHVFLAVETVQVITRVREDPA